MGGFMRLSLIEAGGEEEANVSLGQKLDGAGLGGGKVELRAKKRGQPTGTQPRASCDLTGASDKKWKYVLGVDPGPTESAYAIIRSDYTITQAAKVPNADLSHHILSADRLAALAQVAIEGLVCYGRPVGRETFETAYMVGEIRQICRMAEIPWTIYARPVYANAIAGCGKVTDAVLYQALRLRFGSNSKGGPLYPLRGHSDLRSAFAIAAYWLDCHQRSSSG